MTRPIFHISTKDNSTARFLVDILRANDIGTRPIMAFDALRNDGRSITTRPLFSFRNVSTPILDIEKTGLKLHDATITSSKVTTLPDPALESGVLGFKEIDANNNGWFIKRKKGGAIVESDLEGVLGSQGEQGPQGEPGRGVASVHVFKEGSTYVAQTFDDKVLATSTTDASVVFNAAINDMPGGSVSGNIIYKGRIFVHSAVYDCKTMINFDGPTLGYHGLQMMGEGMATRLNFTPSSALDTAIMDRMSRLHLGYMRIHGNSNVTNLLKIDGTVDPKNRWFTNLEYLMFDGANYNTGGFESGLAAYQPGQKGIFATADGLGIYFWSIFGCFFRGLEYGLHLHNQHTTSSMQGHLSFLNCRIGEKVSGSQHHINNVWIQGNLDRQGEIGFWFVPDPPSTGTGVGSLTNISNVMFEMYSTDDITTDPGIEFPALAGSDILNIPNLPKPGAIGILRDVGAVNHHTINIHAVSAPGGKIVDLNTYTSFDNEERFVNRVSKNLGDMVGTWLPGAVALGKEGGILCGNVVEDAGAGSFSNVSLTGGPVRRFSTGGIQNTIMSMYYSFGGTSYWSRTHNPQISVRFFTSQIDNLRLFIGLWQSFTAPTSTDDILNGKSGVGIWVDQAVSSNYRVMHNDGTGASTKTDFASPQALTVGKTLQAMISTNYDAGAFTAMIDGKYKTVSTDIPSSGTFGWLISLENTAAENKQLSIYEIEMSARSIK